MNNPEIFDMAEIAQQQSELRIQQRKYVIYCFTLALINSVFYIWLVKGFSTTEGVQTVLNTNFIAFPVLGFMLGSLFAIIPYKKLTYGKKYLRASLLTILVIHGIFFVGLSILLLMKLAGWY